MDTILTDVTAKCPSDTRGRSLTCCLEKNNPSPGSRRAQTEEDSNPQTLRNGRNKSSSDISLLSVCTSLSAHIIMGRAAEERLLRAAASDGPRCECSHEISSSAAECDFRENHIKQTTSVTAAARTADQQTARTQTHMRADMFTHDGVKQRASREHVSCVISYHKALLLHSGSN